jgi:Ni,Fe-hydrogenase III component G
MLVGVDWRGLDPDAGLSVEEVMAVPDGPVVRLRVDLPVTGPSFPSLTSIVPAAQ